MIVAIDGPAGAGKSSVALRLGATLGLTLVDTGAIYRVAALAAREQSVAIEDDAALGKLMPLLAEQLSFTQANGRTTVRLAGRDVSDLIRVPEMSLAASAISARPVVRAALLELQRSLGRGAPPPGAVLEGRDIGTVVFPQAEAKFFLTASPEVRAERRQRELAARGIPASVGDVLRDQEKRDRDDASRAVAPLREAADAIRVDSTSLTLEEVVDRMVEELRLRSLLP